METKANDQNALKTQPEENGDQTERTFTQDEVNRIVKDRLAKERAKTEHSQQEHDDQREKELNARECRIECREFLLEKGYPSDMLDSMDTSNPEKFKQEAERIYTAIARSCADNLNDFQGRETPSFTPFDGKPKANELDQAFSRSAKHTPKKW